MDDDKPFSCTFRGCNEKFVTEDRLSVHVQKHDLNFDGLTASLFTDQTPTPTTFLRDCDNLGLFQDLPLTSKNPFDESFRKAVSEPDTDSAGNGGDTPLLPDSANVLGALDTPTSLKYLPSFMKYNSVFLTPDVNKLQTQMSNGNLDTPSLDTKSSSKRAIPDSPFSAAPPSNLLLGLPRSSRSRKSSTSTLSDCGGSESVVSVSSSADIVGSVTPDVIESPIAPAIGSVSEEDNSAVVLSHIQPQPNAPTVSGGVALSALPLKVPVPSSQIVTASLPIVSSVVPAVNKNTQSLVLHINNLGKVCLVPATQQIVAGAGTQAKVIPVSISQSPVKVTSQANGVQPTSNMSAPQGVAADSSQSSLSLAKQKLKQALTKQQQNPQSADGTTLSDTETSSTRSRHPSSPTRGLKRMYSRSDNDEEMDKRLKSLQRNRDAARRCRKKKKVFMQSLEERLKASNQLIAQLQSENTKLKVEIAQLKSLFIAHKDCEVTKMQITEGSLSSYPLS